MRYFTYISVEKVEQFIQQIEEYDILEYNENRIEEKNKSIAPGLSNFLGVFKLGITFGRKNQISVAEVKKKTTIQKLSIVLDFLKDKQEVPDLLHTLNDNLPLKSLYYWYSGNINYVSNDNHYVKLEIKIKDIKIELNASLKYFSDISKSGDMYVTENSGGFFWGVNLNCQSLIIIQGRNDNTIIGTPLFISINSID